MFTRRLAIPALVTLFLQMFPTAALAAGCSLQAIDSVAGLGSQVTVTSCSSGTVITVTSPTGGQFSLDASTNETGSAVVVIPSRNTQTAGTYRVQGGGASAAFTVIADRADDTRSTLTASPISASAGEAVTVTAILRDRFDNPVAGRPMALLSNRISDDIVARSAQTDDNGRFLWSVTARDGGTMTLIPYDVLSGRQLKLRADVVVRGGISTLGASLTGFEQGGDSDLLPPVSADLSSAEVDEFELTLPENATSVKANELFSMNLRALKNGAVVRGYIGSLVVESSDTDAELPKKGEDPNSPSTGRIDMRSVDQGQRNIPLSFLLRRSGPQTITVHDKVDTRIRGTITINVLRAGGAAGDTIVILSPQDRSKIKGHTVLLQGKAPSLVNLKVKGGAREVMGETDEEGVFRISVDLVPEDREATLFVTSENGTYESQALHVIVDNDAPSIVTVDIDPKEGRTGAPAEIRVTSGEELGTATALLQGVETPLTESGTNVYVGIVTAPSAPGTYDITLTALDSVGNQSVLLTKWTVAASEVPVVTGVKAKGESKQVSLSWNPVEGTVIKSYTVYIADDKEPENILYSVSTGEAVTSAVIKDLPLGTTYRFMLTAVNDKGEESPEKSEPAVAGPIGLVFSVRPGSDNLVLQWVPLQNLPLARYDLEYGVEPNVYTERKTVDGAAVTTTLRDLIGGVTYYVKLTPVAVTGKVLSDFVATGSGMPGGTGFVAGAGDPVPTDVLENLHSGADLRPTQTYRPPAETPRSGISTPVAGSLLLLAFGIGLFYRHYRRQRLLAAEFLRLMQERYHS